MSIRVVTDSTCDLPDSLIAEYDIAVVPLYINVGDEGYLDGVELSRQEFYERLPDYDPPPTTAAPGPEVFRQTYDRLADEGATEVLSMHISSSLSATIDTARLAARDTTRLPVTPFDSQQLSLGTGFLVLAAARAAAQGHSMNEILALLEEQILRTYVFAALDTLEFLRRSGRMSWAVAGLGSLLQIKPVLKMYNGDPTSERVRTNNGATKRLIEMVQELGPLEELALVHTNAPERAATLWRQAQHLFTEGKTPLTVNVTPAIGTHIGPGVVGFACIKATSE